MSQEKMEALIDMADWYASPLGTFIRMSKLSLDKLIMQEVLYHISIGLSARLHRKKNAPCPTLPLWIRWYEIQNFKNVHVETEEFKKFTFGTRSFNMYDMYFFVKDHCARV